jgi:hypothetical protein
MLVTKYKLETDRFLFKADYDTESNIIYNHHEDKQTKEIFVTENHGAINGRIKFNNDSIDDYVTQAEGAAFPILVDPIGFVFTYDDLEARKSLIGETKFQELVVRYPRLVHRINSLSDFTQVIYKVQTEVNFSTGNQVTKVIFDNTEDNWWSSLDTPAYPTDKLFTAQEREDFDRSLKAMVYLNPIERYIWNVINMIPKID